MKVHSSVADALKGTFATIVAVTILVPVVASAKEGERSGREVFDTVCAACHATGQNGAPRIGDSKAWQTRAERGLTGLTKNALAGIRKMPPHGGNPGLTDMEIERAITYMVNASGGAWTEPITKASLPPERSGEQVVGRYCYACHETGVGGAPQIGARDAWIPRAQQGLDALTRSAINGHGGMPPRGGVANLTDVELRSAIGYMLNPRTMVASKAPARAQEVADPNHHVIGATDVYLGIVSAAALRAQHHGVDAESKMHGAIPKGRDEYHVTIALFDRTTKSPIVDARVEAHVIGRADQVKLLEPMVLNDTVTYGNYFRLPANDACTIALTIRVPGSPGPMQTQFQVVEAQ